MARKEGSEPEQANLARFLQTIRAAILSLEHWRDNRTLDSNSLALSTTWQTCIEFKVKLVIKFCIKFASFANLEPLKRCLYHRPNGPEMSLCLVLVRLGFCKHVFGQQNSTFNAIKGANLTWPLTTFYTSVRSQGGTKFRADFLHSSQLMNKLRPAPPYQVISNWPQVGHWPLRFISSAGAVGQRRRGGIF